ncbi:MULTISPECIES: ABC transporter ATP-binding protein [unclassified Neisseria]|uniref:ABC transporter ATP-binding protein n=1 Tax=unclassified Neisseria TaxID=2623750 RepID=UPI001072DC2D|nr:MULTISPECIES: ABC transporter ATP-binding protein [unclassified Neisseria]MBF0804487.1 ABC transporter ATP-binding protein [Neisseria sp. 19428wB4_WF04]TFU40503.1 ABC transporter ATP-binding protein [Neisseria sp. WF04]
MKAIIEFRGVGKHYGNKHVISGLNLSIFEGEFFVMVGPSGCGKTTTLKMINALTEPSEGNVYFNDRRIKDYDIRRLRHRIGYVLQQIALFPTMTVKQNIELVPDILGWSKTERSRRSGELLEMVGMPPAKYAHRYPRELSGGEQQRIGILRAIAAKPDVLLMDEPFSALDPLSRNALQEMVADIHRRLSTTIIFVTHNMSEAQRLAGRIAVMQDGKLQQTGTPEELQTRPANEFVRSFFQSEHTDYGKISQIANLLPLSSGNLPELDPDDNVSELFALLSRHPRVRIRGLGEIDGSRVFDYLHNRQNR